jgi:hypothetical protein
MSDPIIDDETLRSYLADALPGEDLARVEKALRDSAELRARLEEVRQNRGDPNLHTLGAIWRRSRLTCPTRDQLGSFLLDVLDPGLADYVKFHVEVVECEFCKANLADLKARANQSSSTIKNRHNRIIKTIQDLLGEDSRG